MDIKFIIDALKKAIEMLEQYESKPEETPDSVVETIEEAIAPLQEQKADPEKAPAPVEVTPPVKDDGLQRMSDKGLKLLTQWEGFRTKVYKDAAGLPTIGVGHLLTKDEKSSGKLKIGKETVRYADGLTNAQVIELLRQDVAKYEKTVRDNVKVDLNQNQFDALVSFCFNVGQKAFADSTLLKRVNAKNFADVPTQLLRWTRAGGKKLQGLVNRRNNEIKLWKGQI